MEESQLVLSLKDTTTRMQDGARADRFAGVGLITVRSQALFECCVGYALRWAKIPVTRNTRFPLASTSKLFTVVAIGQLIATKKLALDDLLRTWLPSNLYRHGWEDVRLGHLLSHTSGFGSYWGNEYEARRYSLKGTADYFPLFQDKPLSFEPGASFEYSNAGYIVLGAVIERVSGLDYDEYVRRNIFERVGMNDTGYFESDEDTPNLAVGYTFVKDTDTASGGGSLRTNTPWRPAKGTAAGDAISTAPDLVLFAEALMAGKLMPLEVFDLLRSPIVDMPRPPGAKFRQRMSHGFMTLESKFGTPIGHTGGSIGINTSLFFDPSSGLISVLLSSSDREEYAPIYRALTSAWLDRDLCQIENEPVR